jgi:hypothetical protein
MKMNVSAEVPMDNSSEEVTTSAAPIIRCVKREVPTTRNISAVATAEPTQTHPVLVLTSSVGVPAIPLTTLNAIGEAAEIIVFPPCIHNARLSVIVAFAPTIGAPSMATVAAVVINEAATKE